MKQFRHLYIILLLVTTITIFYWFILEPYGLGVTADSTYYIIMAESFTQNNHFLFNNKFITHWPPGYPFFLGITCKLFGNSNILFCAKLFHLFILNIIFLVFYYILKELKCRKWVIYILPAIMVLSLPVFSVTIHLLSELLFMLFLLLIYIFLLFWKRTYNNKFLIIMGVLSGILFLIRYAAIGFIAGFSLMILYYLNLNKKRYIIILYYWLPMLVIYLGWRYYVMIYHAPIADRSVSFHPISFFRIFNGIQSIIYWFIPKMNRLKYFFPIIMLLLIIFSFNRKKSQYRALFFKKILHDDTIISLSILIISYLLFLMVSISLFDFNTPFNGRIFYVFYPFLLIILFKTINYILNVIYFYIFYGLFIIAAITNTYIKAKIFYNNGIGYTGKNYRQIERYIQEELNTDKKDIYTNLPDYIYFKFKKKVYELPRKLSPDKIVNDSTYSEHIYPSYRTKQNFYFNLDSLLYKVEHRQAKIILFPRYKRKYYIAMDSIMEIFPSNYLHKINDYYIVIKKSSNEQNHK